MFHETDNRQCDVCHDTNVHQCFQSMDPLMTKGPSVPEHASHFSSPATQSSMVAHVFCHIPQSMSPKNVTSYSSTKAPPLDLSMNELWGGTNSWESYFSYLKNTRHDRPSLEEPVLKNSSQRVEETGSQLFDLTGQSTRENDSCHLFYDSLHKRTHHTHLCSSNGELQDKNITTMSLFNTLMQSLEQHGTSSISFSKSQETPKTDCLKRPMCLTPYERNNIWEECCSCDFFKEDSFVPEYSTVATSAFHPTETTLHDDSQEVPNISQSFGTTHLFEADKEPFQWNASLNYLLEYCKRHHEANILQKTCFSFEDSLFLDFVLLMLYKENRRPSKQRIHHYIHVFNGSTFLQNNFLKYYQIVSSKYRISSFQSNDVYIYLKKNPSWFQGWAESEVSNCPLSITFLIEFHDYLIQVLRWSQMKKIQAIFLSNKTCPIDHRKNLCVLENKNKMQNTKNASDSSFEITFQNTYFLAKQIKDISSVYFPFCTLSQLCNIIELATNLGLLVCEDSCVVPKACSFSVTSKFVDCDPEAYGIETDISSKFPAPVPNTLSTNSLEVKSQLEQSIKNVEDMVRERKFKPLLLSQFKTKYFQKYHQELDTLALGYPRLSDFIKQYCSHFCRFIRTKNRQVFVDRVRNQCKDTSQTAQTVFKTETDHETKPATCTTPEENDSLTVSEALLSLLSKHRRFHNNISFSFWQYCTFCNKARDQDGSLLCGAAATFTDLLFASILKPTSTEPFVASSHEVSSTDASSLRWFTREPLIQRRLRLNTLASDNHTLQDLVFNVLPPKLSETTFESEVFKLPRPSRLRRYVTSQIAQLNQGIFNAVPNIVIY